MILFRVLCIFVRQYNLGQFNLEAGKELPFARFGERGNSIRIK